MLRKGAAVRIRHAPPSDLNSTWRSEAVSARFFFLVHQSGMSTGLWIRSTCQSCQTRGRFRPLETMCYRPRAWEWRLHVLCAICRQHLEQQLLDNIYDAPQRRHLGSPARTT
jgi:hypothetical protein